MMRPHFRTLVGVTVVIVLLPLHSIPIAQAQAKKQGLAYSGTLSADSVFFPDTSGQFLPQSSEPSPPPVEIEADGRHPYWQFDLGESFPIGSASRFRSPVGDFAFDAPTPLSRFYRPGYTVNTQFGVMTDDGFDFAGSLRFTKMNYTHAGNALITGFDDTFNPGREGDISSYVFETQLILSRRFRPFDPRHGAIYAGFCGSLGTVENYSSAVEIPDDESFAISVLFGYEAPLAVEISSGRALALRPQIELVALTSGDRPGYLNFSIGIRGYRR